MIIPLYKKPQGNYEKRNYLLKVTYPKSEDTPACTFEIDRNVKGNNEYAKKKFTLSLFIE